MSNQVENVVIIGSGPSGLTAALYGARANLAPVVFHGRQPGGQLTTTTHVENYPGFPGGIMGPELMQAMEKQAEHFGAKLVEALVTGVDLSAQPFRVIHESGELHSKVVIVATGASARWLGIDREAELMGYGLSTCATCDGAFYREKEIVVVGGGDSACEEALFLTKFGRRVRLVVRRDVLRASRIMADRVKTHPKIQVLWHQNLSALIGDRKGGVTGAILEHSLTHEKTQIECDGIFYAIGHTPNTKLFKGVLDMDDNGYLVTAPDSTRTNIAGVFACGDVKDHIFRQAITAAGSGCMAAIEAERYLAEL